MHGLREQTALTVAICAASVTGCVVGEHAVVAGSARDVMDAAVADNDGDKTPPGDIAYARLADVRDFRPFPAEDDPLASHQPANIQCVDSAFVTEYGGLEIDTGLCNYVLAATPSLRDVAKGAWVHLDFVHYDLAAPAPAEAHVALLFADELQWEERIPVPSAGARVEATFRAKSALVAGDMVRIHLHNHGGNTYLLTRLEVEAGSAASP
ncbi:MAG: hypothetical protein RL385_4809 [Pseudomonadota bacterium]